MSFRFCCLVRQSRPCLRLRLSIVSRAILVEMACVVSDTCVSAASIVVYGLWVAPARGALWVVFGVGSYRVSVRVMIIILRLVAQRVSLAGWCSCLCLCHHF